MPELPYIERVKIQSEILLPFYQRLRNEIGVERANELLREAVSEFAATLGAAVSEREGSSLDKLRTLVPVFTAGQALDVEMIADTAEEMTFNVTRCAYSSYFHELGEPEFGAMLTCEIDPPMTDAIGEDLSLERRHTIMSGHQRCDFRWKMS